MAEAILQKFDLDKYLWKSLPDGQGRIRPLAGGEYSQDTFNRLRKGDQTLFLAVYVDLASPIPESALAKASRDAWLWLRYHIPTIAASLSIDDQGVSNIIYRTASPATADQWADRTFIPYKRDGVDLDQLRREVGQGKIPSSAGDQTWLHLVSDNTDASKGVSRFGLLLHTHHAPFDGSGTKVLLNRYLTHLATLLGTWNEGGEESLEWGKEVDNLPPAVFNVLGPAEPTPIPKNSSDEPSFALPYYASLGGFLQELGDSLQNPYGFKPRGADPGWPSTRREEIIFSQEESDAILRALKPTGSETKYTVAHLAHTALAMTVVSNNPPTPESAGQFMNSFGLMDSRSSLKEPYSSRDGYPGYALAITMMRVPVSTFQAENGSVLPLDKNTLAKAIKVVRGLYVAQKATPGTLSYMGQGAEIFGAVMQQAVEADKFPPNQSYHFSSDGLGEKYFRSTYNDGAGKAILSVTKFFTSLNRIDPGPFFRVSSWNGLIDLSVDFNSNLVSVEDAKAYMAQWKEFILLVTQFDEGDH